MTTRGFLRTAVLLLAGVIAAAAPASADAAAGAASALKAATSDICVSVVVDRSSVSANCVKVPPGSTGAQVLIARAKQLGRTAPRFDSTGLVCGIDGYPATGCAEASGGGFSYWSYWHKHGTGAWQYSSAGAFLYTVGGTQPSEGWAWIEGGEGTRQPASPSYASVCPPSITNPGPTAKPKPTPTVKPTSKPTARPRPSATASTPAQWPPTRLPTRPPTRSIVRPTSPVPTAPSAAARTSASRSPAGIASSAAGPASPGSRSAPPDQSPGPATQGAASSASAPATDSATSSPIAAEPAAAHPSSGLPAGLLIGIGLVVAVGAASGYQIWRRRTRP